MNTALEPNKSGMAAVLGLSCSEIELIIKDFSLSIEVANDNAPGQVVISGIIADINRSEEIFIQNGAKKIVYLNVSSAFHSRIMIQAEEKMKMNLSKIDFKDATYSLISNFSATASNDKKEIYNNLSKQMSNKVKWTDSIKLLENMNENKIIEIGPGKVLNGLIKRISSNFNLYNLNNIKDIEVLNNVI